MISYFERVKYLYPDLQGYCYWHQQRDGTEWADPYDGLVWENTEVAKPSKETLDALDEATVQAEMDRREEEQRKQEFITKSQSDSQEKVLWAVYKLQNPNSTIDDCYSYYKGVS